MKFVKISFSNKLFLSILVMFIMIGGCFTFYQYHREKAFRIELLDCRLQDFNKQMNEAIDEDSIFDDSVFTRYVMAHAIPHLRVTIIHMDGHVIYDNEERDVSHMKNHKNRMEIAQALKTGNGYDIYRASETLGGHTYFYSATYFKKRGYIIRSALPYDINLMKTLSADIHYVWFTLIVGVIIILLLYRFTKQLGRNISNLQEFAERIEKNEPFNELRGKFSEDELGDISQHIVGLYERLNSSELDKVRLKRQLTQNIAHELKTPVSSIQGYLETLVSNKNMQEQTKRDFLERCYAQSNRLSNLLRDISVLTRMDEAPELIQKEDVDINVIVGAIQKEVEHQLKEKKIEFLLMLIDNIHVKGNPSLLYSVFRNLTDNAIAYAGENTCITVKCMKEDEKFYYFSFSDNGVGVGKEHLPFLFERFYRVDKGRSRKLGGTGLGLAVVKNAVNIHGGNITAKIAQTGGLEFDFTLGKEG